MEKKYNNIDDLFREEFSGFSEEPSPAVWQALEKRLDNRKKKRAFYFKWYWFVGIISFITLLGASVAWLVRSPNPDIADKAISVHSGTDIYSPTNTHSKSISKSDKLIEKTPSQEIVTTEKVIENKLSKNKKASGKNRRKHHRKKQSHKSENLQNTGNAQDVSTQNSTTLNAPTVGTSAYSYDQFEAKSEVEKEPMEAISQTTTRLQVEGFVKHTIKGHKIVAVDMKPVVVAPDTSRDNHVASRIATAVDAETGEDNTVKVASTESTPTDYPIGQNVAEDTDKSSDEDIVPAPVKNKSLAAVKESSVNKSESERISRFSKALADAQPDVHPPFKVSAAAPVSEEMRNAVIDTLSSQHKVVNNQANKGITGVADNLIPDKESVNDTLVDAQPRSLFFFPESIVKMPELAAMLFTITKTPFQIKPVIIEPVGKPTIAETMASSDVAVEKSIRTTPIATKKEVPEVISVAPVNDVAVPVILAVADQPDSASLSKKRNGGKREPIGVAESWVGNLGATSTPFAIGSLPTKQLTGKGASVNSAGTPNTVSAKATEPLTPVVAGIDSFSVGPIGASGLPSAHSSVDSNRNIALQAGTQPAKDEKKNPLAEADGGATTIKGKKESAVGDTSSKTKPIMSGRFSFGLKGGYEGSWQKNTANKTVISPYVQFRIGKKLSLLFQPAIKGALAPKKDIGNPQQFYNVHQGTGEYQLRDSALTFLILTGDTMWLRNYSYTEIYDSVVKSYSSGGSYMEIEMPLLLQYRLLPRLSVYGGLNVVYSKQLGAKEHTYTASGLTATGNASTLLPLYTQPTLPMTTGLNYSGQALSTYSGPAYPATQPGLFRMGYMLGVSYELKKRWSADLLMQQCFAKPKIQGGYNINSPLSAPYIRITLGYRLSK